MPERSAGLRVAAVQLRSSADTAYNVAVAERLVEQAVASDARFVVLPEKWNLIGPDELQLAGAEALSGPSISAVQGWAATHGAYILAGSLSEATDDPGQVFNTSVMIDPSGTVTAVYRKRHLFDVEVGGREYRESDITLAGDDVVLGAVDGHPVGMSVCYDLRFPELYRSLSARGAEVIAVPAAFTATTGAAHWEPLLRARAIENQAFVVAAGQCGTHDTGAASWGHSMIVDPWGVILAEAGGDEGVIVADLDFGELNRIRATLPALRHRRDLE